MTCSTDTQPEQRRAIKVSVQGRDLTTIVCSLFPHHPPQKNVDYLFYDCQMVDSTESLLHPRDCLTPHKTGRGRAFPYPSHHRGCRDLQTLKKPTPFVPTLFPILCKEFTPRFRTSSRSAIRKTLHYTKVHSKPRRGTPDELLTLRMGFKPRYCPAHNR